MKSIKIQSSHTTRRHPFLYSHEIPYIIPNCSSLGKLLVWLRQTMHRNKHHQSIYSLCIPTSDRRTKKMIRRTLSAPKQSIWKHESQKKRMIRVAVSPKAYAMSVAHPIWCDDDTPKEKHLLRYSSSDWPTAKAVDILHLRRCTKHKESFAINFLCNFRCILFWKY